MAGPSGNGSQLCSRNGLSPWNRPQSIKTQARGVSTRKRLPVTVSVAPRKYSNGTEGRDTVLMKEPFSLWSTTRVRCTSASMQSARHMPRRAAAHRLNHVPYFHAPREKTPGQRGNRSVTTPQGVLLFPRSGNTTDAFFPEIRILPHFPLISQHNPSASLLRTRTVAIGTPYAGMSAHK